MDVDQDQDVEDQMILIMVAKMVKVDLEIMLVSLHINKGNLSKENLNPIKEFFHKIKSALNTMKSRGNLMAPMPGQVMPNSPGTVVTTLNLFYII